MFILKNPAASTDIHHRINESAVTLQAESSTSSQVSVRDTSAIRRIHLPGLKNMYLAVDRLKI